jgi:hypothetical protein
MIVCHRCHRPPPMTHVNGPDPECLNVRLRHSGMKRAAWHGSQALPRPAGCQRRRVPADSTPGNPVTGENPHQAGRQTFLKFLTLGPRRGRWPIHHVPQRSRWAVDHVRVWSTAHPPRSPAAPAPANRAAYHTETPQVRQSRLTYRRVPYGTYGPRKRTRPGMSRRRVAALRDETGRLAREPAPATADRVPAPPRARG